MLASPNIRIHKAYKKYGDAWGELFRYGFRGRLKGQKILDILGKRPQHNSRYYQFTFYVGGFGFTRKRKTKYGQAFVQKQRIKFLYGSRHEKSLRKKWKRAKNLRNINAIIPSFFNILESSLFMILIRSGIAVNFRDATSVLLSRRAVIKNTESLSPPVLGHRTKRLKMKFKSNANAYSAVSKFSLIRLKIARSLRKSYKFLIRRRFHKLLPVVSYIDVDFTTLSFYYRGVNNRNLPYFTFKFNFNKLFNVYYV